MRESDKTPPPRRTIAVTVAGVLLLLPAAASAFMAIAFRSPVGLLVAGIVGYAGLATIRRWRGWRIWAGAMAWVLIALVVLSLFATPPPPGTDRSWEDVMALVSVAIAVFVLIAKRLERRPDYAAVFDD
jgi:hypothetical protein